VIAGRTRHVGDVLVVGYGSDLRGDDAAGRHAADAVAGRALPGVRVLSLPQLLPEVADDLSRADLAIFVDASVDDERVPVRTVAPRHPRATVAPRGALGAAGVGRRTRHGPTRGGREHPGG
jgi:hypothetical protein